MHALFLDDQCDCRNTVLQWHCALAGLDPNLRTLRDSDTRLVEIRFGSEPGRFPPVLKLGLNLIFLETMSQARCVHSAPTDVMMSYALAVGCTRLVDQHALAPHIGRMQLLDDPLRQEGAELDWWGTQTVWVCKSGPLIGLIYLCTQPRS